MTNQMNEGEWITQCTSCRATIFQRDMGYHTDSPTACDQCQEVLDGTDDMFGPPSVNKELGWCGCGDPERINIMMRNYLRSRTHPDWPKPTPDGVGSDTAMLLAYIADKQHWTDHGTSIGGAWLTDDGREALTNLEEICAAQGE